MMTTSGRKLRTPVCIHSRLPSNQSALRTSSSVWTAPSASPPATAMGIDRSPPISAAASAGTISAVSPTGVIVPAIGTDDDHGERRQDRGDHPVDGGESLRRVAEQHGTLLVAGGGTGGEAEAGVPVPRPHDEAHQQGEADDVEGVAREDLAEAEEVVDRLVGHDALAAEGTSCRS